MNDTTNSLSDFQIKSLQFYEIAEKCDKHCIKDYKSRELSEHEKDCVTSCFAKQMVIFGTLYEAIEKEN